MNFAGILTAFKDEWAGHGSPALLPTDNIYFDRAQQPAALAGFPYMEVFLSQVGQEVATMQGGGTTLTTYELSVKVYSVQDQTGGSSTGDPVDDCSNIQESLDVMMSGIPPNTAWNGVDGFLHSVPIPGATVAKDELLFDGRDVYVYVGSWHLLVGE